MSYQVIARKYRPQRFEDVVGQEHVTQTLMNAIQTGRIAHGYLFCGPRGTGKTTLARIFAKALNCTGGPKIAWDESDPRVREITEGRALDVMEIDGASNNGVEQIRDLREAVRFAPSSGKFKIYIIDEVHMLTVGAFNALLKTLEEPPAHVKFFFATTDPEKVLPTILSRCQRFDLRRIPAPLIVKHLAWIAEQEKVSVEDAALHAIARGADGGMRDAESTLDQLISFCGNTIVEGDVLSMFGLAARAQILQLAGALVEGSRSDALRTLDSLAHSGKDLSRLLSDLLNHLRNLMLFQISRGDRGWVSVSDAEWKSLEEQSPKVDSDGLTRIVEVLSQAESRQRESHSKRIFLEVTLVKAIQARNAIALDVVLDQLRALREGSSVATPSSPSVPVVASRVVEPAIGSRAETGGAISRSDHSTPVEKVVASPGVPTLPAKPTEIPPPLANPNRPDASASAATKDPMDLWPQVLGALGPIKRHAFDDGKPMSVVRGVLTVAFPRGSEQFELVNTRENVALVQTKFREFGVPELTVKFVEMDEMATAKSEAAPAGPSAPNVSAVPKQAPNFSERPKPSGNSKTVVTPLVLNKDEFLNDPLIKDALEIFKGRLVEVRGPQASGN